MVKLAGNKILKLICYGTDPIGNIPEKFETIDESSERLKVNGLKLTVNRIAKTWFVKKDKSEYFYLCENTGRQISLKTADNGLIAMKNDNWYWLKLSIK